VVPVIAAPTKDHNRGVFQSITLSATLRNCAVRISSEREKSKEHMFDQAHAFIEGRQHEVANELMDWRNTEVAEWKKTLEEVPLSGMTNGVPPPRSGAADQNGGSSS
jgi:hypothetical protein